MLDGIRSPAVEHQRQQLAVVIEETRALVRHVDARECRVDAGRRATRRRGPFWNDEARVHRIARWPRRLGWVAVVGHQSPRGRVGSAGLRIHHGLAGERERLAQDEFGIVARGERGSRRARGGGQTREIGQRRPHRRGEPAEVRGVSQPGAVADHRTPGVRILRGGGRIEPEDVTERSLLDRRHSARLGDLGRVHLGRVGIRLEAIEFDALRAIRIHGAVGLAAGGEHEPRCHAILGDHVAVGRSE